MRLGRRTAPGLPASALTGTTGAVLLLVLAGCSAAGVGGTDAGNGPGGAEVPQHGEAVPLDAAAISGWAADYSDYTPGTEADSYTEPARALGPAQGIATEVLVLGRGGSVTLTFDGAISDGPGADLAVYENGLGERSALFGELAFVEVSSDGTSFVRFPTHTTRRSPVGQYETFDATAYAGFAGLHPKSTGTAFDLGELAELDPVRNGTVDLSGITHVRLIDLIGDGSAVDSAGNPVYDPHPTEDTAGFDLDGVAVLAGDGGSK